MTEQGRLRLKELHDDAQAVDAELRSFLTKSEIDVMGKALMKIHDHFTATKEERDADRR